MLRNYIKIAWRNIRRNKSYTFINIVGLSMGIACSIVIFAFVSYQLSFDGFHKNKDRIYRFVTEWHDEDINYSGAVPSPAAKAFRSNYTYGEKTARIIDYQNSLIAIPGSAENKKFKEEDGIAYTEPEFFDIFDYPLIKGDKNSFLKNPNSAAITEKMAKKYFGSEEAIGKTIRVNNRTNFIITGVLKDFPANTDRRQQIYLSYANLIDQNRWLAKDSGWGGVYSGCKAYTLLKPSISKAQAETGLKQIIAANYKGRDLKTWQFKLQPLSDIHFNTDYDGSADRKYLWAFFFIGLFLIITACVNFINLATAQALNRSKEIGIRKVLGSLPSQLFWQFIAETAMITLFALLIACALAALVLPYVNSLFKTEIALHYLTNTPLLLFLGLIFLLVTFLSGSYPGLVLARFQPVLALKSKLSQKHIGGFSLRRILVVTQFAISQMLIIGTIVIASQMHYSKNTELGFNKKAILLMPLPTTDKVKASTLRTRMTGVAGVEDISLCFAAPAAGSNNTTNLRFDSRAEDEHFSVNTKSADENYLKTFGIKLAAGRNFFPSDTIREYLVNETFVKKLGLKSPGDVIGKMASINGIKAPVIGVVKDFYNYSFHSEISAVAIMPSADNYRTCAVRINMNNLKPAIATLENIWSETYPEYLFEYRFLDDSIAEFYELDTIMLTLIEAFAAIAVLIGALGLYGLVSFMAVRKTKEIGVRKVLGARISNILWLFGKEFTKLLLIAFVIAAPVAWWAMTKYLQDFKNQIKLGAGIFVMAIVCTFLIAAITVGYRSIKAALANPVKSLRTE